MEQIENPINGYIRQVEEYYDADIYLLAAGIYEPYGFRLRTWLYDGQTKLHRNGLLILSTYGGNPDVAYRIARAFQDVYNVCAGKTTPSSGEQSQNHGKFYLFVNGPCKSSGTLIAIGADELILTENAELGPIDIQVTKTDEVGERTSVLVPSESFTALQKQAVKMFGDFFRQLRYANDFSFSTRLAADVANSLTTGLLSPVYGQIDPTKVAEMERALRIGAGYAERLCRQNLKDGAIGKLLAGYPSHGFIIDRREAKELFETVSEPSEALRSLGNLFCPSFMAEKQLLDESRWQCYPLKQLPTEKEDNDNVRKNDERNNSGPESDGSQS